MLKTIFIPFMAIFPFKSRMLKLLHSVSCAFPRSSLPVQQKASVNVATHHQLPPASAYIHLPFCRKRCHYCDFPIVALGLSSTKPNQDDPRISNYIELICREINAMKPDCQANPPLETVFFGGGTPSLVPPSLVSLILNALKVKFGLSLNAEISMEMDPGTFDARKMEQLMELGVNRVSLGVQAFQDEMLKACGRAHGVKEVYEAIEIVGSCGVENWSLDLISSLPRQTQQMWEESLTLTVEAHPKHVSIYDLQVEQGTKFGALYTPGEFPLPSEIQSADFYRMASDRLGKAGYNHYEISSYCKDGFECEHNLTYWRNEAFYGFGLGSASYVKGMRFSRPRKMKEYTEYVQNLENGIVDCCGNGHVDAKDLAMDAIMLSLRTSRGLELRPFQEAFGCSLVNSICEAFKPYVESRHVVCLNEQRTVVSADEFSSLLSSEGELTRGIAYIRLSDPDGFLLSNELISFAFGAIAP